MIVDIDAKAQLMNLAKRVKEMRDKQREYFDVKRRTANSIHEAKYREAVVDHLVNEILDDQPKLF